MAQIYRGVAVVKGSNPHRYTMVAIYSNAYSGIQTTSHLLAKPLVEHEMRAHLRRTGLSHREIDAALAAASDRKVDRI